MCQFNFILLKRGSLSCKNLIREFKLNYLDLNVRGIPGDYIFLATSGNSCDCGSIVGSSYKEEGRTSDLNIKKLIKQGWSQSKIDRYQADVKKEIFQSASVEQEKINLEFNLLHEIMTKFVRVQGLAGLFYHQFEGSIVDEDIIIHDQIDASLNNIDRSTLSELPENTILWIE